MRLRSPLYQSGAVLILFFVGLIIASASVIIAGLNNRSPQQQDDIRVRRGLQEAKMEVLAYAALYTDYNPAKGPGRFPCPDTTNDGAMNCNSSTSIGRLPLSIGRVDLGIDQQFWLVVAPAFQHKTTAPDVAINSSTAGGLTLDGNPIVALLIAPGQTVAGQTRVTTANRTNPTNYLDGTNSSTPAFVSANGTLGENFNDRVLSVRRDELMTVVTPRVAQEIKRVLDAAPTYPATAAFAGFMASPPTPLASWFNFNNWLPQVTYTYVSNTQALVRFSNCNTIFQITAGPTRLVRDVSGESRC